MRQHSDRNRVAIKSQSSRNQHAVRARAHRSHSRSRSRRDDRRGCASYPACAEGTCRVSERMPMASLIRWVPRRVYLRVQRVHVASTVTGRFAPVPVAEGEMGEALKRGRAARHALPRDLQVRAQQRVQTVVVARTGIWRWDEMHAPCDETPRRWDEMRAPCDETPRRGGGRRAAHVQAALGAAPLARRRAAAAVLGSRTVHPRDRGRGRLAFALGRAQLEVELLARSGRLASDPIVSGDAAAPGARGAEARRLGRG